MGRPEGIEAVIASGEKTSALAGKGGAASLPRKARRIARRLATALGQADNDILQLAVAMITKYDRGGCREREGGSSGGLS